MNKIILLVIFFVFLLGVFLIFKFSNKKTLLSIDKTNYIKKIKLISVSASAKEKIIDYDKLYHIVLKKLGYEGTFGDILKLKPKEISNIDKIWEFHKLRNKLAHDFDDLSESKLLKKAKDYELELKKLLNRV